MLHKFTAWIEEPFNSQMSAVRWIAWVGLIVAALMFWGMVLKLLEEAS